MADDAVDISQGLQPSADAAATPATTPATPATPATQPVTPQERTEAAQASIAQTRGKESTDYSVSDAPQFLKDNVGNVVKIAPGEPVALKDDSFGKPELTQAYVDPRDPDTIRVMQPQNMTQNVIDHEMAHVYFDNLEKKGIQFAPVNDKDPYNYSGVEGLKQIGQSDKPINQLLSQEQAARIIQDTSGKVKLFQAMARNGSLSQKDVDEFNQWKAAAAPVIHKLALLSGRTGYAAQPDTPTSVSNIPEMGNQRIDISHGLQPLTSAAPPKPAAPKPAGF